MKISLPLLLAAGSCLLAGPSRAQNPPATATNAVANTNRANAARAQDNTPQAPEVLPGNGLAQHDFLYAGENGDLENIYIVRKGKVAWAYKHDLPPLGEISDAMLLSNGDVLFAHQHGVTEVSADKKVVWNYDAPPHTEIHTAQAIGKDHVLLIENGNPAKLKVINKTSGAVVKEFVLPVGNTNSIHAQFRHARVTAQGNVLVAHLDSLGKAAEYDPSGKEVWSYTMPGPWIAEELKNGNILVTREGSFVREINRKGETVWEFKKADLPEIRIANMQFATRLANGNTIINSWHNKGNGTGVQAFEVSSDKKFVWGLRSWADPDLGPSTIIQVLDEPSAPENVHFGDIK